MRPTLQDDPSTLDSNRRDFLRRAAVVGAAAYAVPAVQVLTMSGLTAASASDPGQAAGDGQNMPGGPVIVDPAPAQEEIDAVAAAVRALVEKLTRPRGDLYVAAYDAHQAQVSQKLVAGVLRQLQHKKDPDQVAIDRAGELLAQVGAEVAEADRAVARLEGEKDLLAALLQRVQAATTISGLAALQDELSAANTRTTVALATAARARTDAQALEEAAKRLRQS